MYGSPTLEPVSAPGTPTAKPLMMLCGIHSIWGLLAMALVVSAFARVRIVSSVRDGVPIEPELLDSLSKAHETLLPMVTYLIGMMSLVYLIWLFRAYSNLRFFDVPGLRFSRWSAVAWHLVPLANLVILPFILSELVKASSKQAQGATLWRRERISRTTLWLYGLTLAGLVWLLAGGLLLMLGGCMTTGEPSPNASQCAAVGIFLVPLWLFAWMQVVTIVSMRQHYVAREGLPPQW